MVSLKQKAHDILVRVGKKILYLLNQDYDDAHIFLVSSSYLWSIMLFLPGTTFDKQTYFLMSQLANEYVWGSAFLIYALAGSALLTFNSPNKYLTYFDAVFGFLLWSITAACVFFSTSQAPAAAAPHIVGSFISWWILIKTGTNND